jgi:cytochrome b6-f complex iron-sulfur subunit
MQYALVPGPESVESGHGPVTGAIAVCRHESGGTLPSTGNTFRTSRRRFLDYLLGGGMLLWLGSVLYPVARYLIPPRVSGPDMASVEAAAVAEMAPGSYKIFRFGRLPGILIRLHDGTFHALSARCTHLDCTVQFRTDTEQVWCACHNGIYDVDGRNISGPPPRPLERFEVVVKDDRVFVRREGQA